jgi:drug/metabolite transporter (DMT)-like permease
MPRSSAALPSARAKRAAKPPGKASGRGTVEQGHAVLLGTLYIAIFGSVIGFLFWSYGVADLGPTRAGQFVHLMPVFGAALSFVFLGEPLSSPQVLGAAFVLAGIVLIETRRLA